MTYSQLDLGDRPYSRQSNPNLREYSENQQWKRSRTKSLPATPRATTPTRIRSRNRERVSNMNGNHSPPSPDEIPVGHNRPTTSTSVFSQETGLSGFSGYPDDYSSIDSRSIGRDSALGPYMSHGYYGGYRDTPDRPNPFLQGSSVASEADNVVQMFLKNMNNPSLGVDIERRPPGRIENLPSPTGPVTESFPEAFAETDGIDGKGTAVTKTVISQLRKDFLEGTTTTQPTVNKKEPPKTNKYLRSENRWTKPSPGSNAVNENMTDVVQGFVVQPAQMHKAEVVHVRQDSTSDEDSADITLKDSVETNGQHGQDDRFEDTAYNNYLVDATNDNHNSQRGQAKKKGFFSSIFKKPPNGKSTKKSPRKQDYYYEEDANSELENFEPFQPDETNASMVALPSSSILEPDEHNQPFNFYKSNERVDLPPTQPLQITRKRSMSKPTDLDEILRLQEEEMSRQLDLEMAKEMPQKSFNAEDVFANDPFFRDAMDEFEGRIKPPVPDRVPVPRNVPTVVQQNFNDPIYENSHNHLYTHHPPSMETTQEIDVDAALGYADEEAIENIEWPTTDLPNEEGLKPAMEVQLDYAPPPQKAKKGIFSFGKKNKKKPGKNDEVSYYIEEPQPEPRTPDALDIEPNEHIIEEKLEIKTPPPIATKPQGFFKFKSKKKSPPNIQSDGKESFNATEDEIDQTKEILEDVGLVQSIVESTTDTEIKDQVVPEIAENIPPQLGPIREEKPSFFNFRGKKTLPTQPSLPPLDQNESVNDVVHTQDPQQQQRSQSSRESSPKRKATKSKVFSGFFKSPGSKKKVSQKEPKQIGTMAPVDVSHLVDEDDDFGACDESSVQYTTPQIHSDLEINNQQQSISELVQNTLVPSSEVETEVETNERLHEAPEIVTADEPIEEVALPSVPQSRSTGSLPMRGRPKEKKKGMMSGFFSAKPPSRPPSQNRQRTPEPEHKPTFFRDRRSKSLPRQPRQNVHRSSGGGLADFFNAKPQIDAGPSNTNKDQEPCEKLADVPPEKSEPLVQNPPSRRPPPKSKSSGGISSFFNMQPKHPRRPRGPPPSPPPPSSQEQQQQQQQQNIAEELNQRRLSTANSVTSISSQRRRESKGLSSFLGSSPLRKSSKGPMPRSQTIDLLPSRPPQGTIHNSQEIQMADSKESRKTSAAATPQNPDFDKIEQVSDQQPRVLDQSSSNVTAIPPANQSARVMGRRSGRFRKTSNQDQTPSQLKGPHIVPPAPATKATHDVTRDIFAEAVNRPSRRGSMSSLNQPTNRADNDILPADSEYDQAINSSSNHAQEQSSKVGRTDSYKQAKNSSINDAGSRNMKNYNSLPRLGKGTKHQNQGRGGGDPETRSLGEGSRQRGRGGGGRGGGRKGDDNCQMM